MRKSLALLALASLPFLAVHASAQPANTPNDAQAGPTSRPSSGPTPPEPSLPTTTPSDAGPATGTGSGSRALTPGGGQERANGITRGSPSSSQPIGPDGNQPGGGN